MHSYVSDLANLLSPMHDRKEHKCATLAEWIDAGGSSHKGLTSQTSQISLLMLRSASLPNGYGFEFDRVLGRVVLRHVAGVVIHGQALLVDCDDVEFDTELSYHYCTWSEFCQLASDGEPLPSSIWRHWRTTRREPAFFAKGPEEVAAVLRGVAPHGEWAQELSCCIPLHQAPPLGSSSLPSESSDVELHFEGLGTELLPQDIRSAAQAQGAASPGTEETEEAEEMERTELLAWESQPDSDWAEIRQRLLEQTQRRERRARPEEDTSVQPLPDAAEAFLLSAMLQHRTLTLSSEWQDVGWDLALKQGLRIWMHLKSKGAQHDRNVKLAFHVSDGSHDAASEPAALAKIDERWLLSASGQEPVRTEKLGTDDEWLWLMLLRVNSGGKCKLHVGSGTSTDRAELGAISVCLPKRPLRVAIQSSTPNWSVELAHSGLLDPDVRGMEDMASIISAVDLKDASGMSVLMHATRAGTRPAVTALLAAKAYVHARDSSLCTALHYAAYEGHAEVAQALLASGGSPFARNCRGVTPRDVAHMRWAARIPGQGEAFEAETVASQGENHGQQILNIFKTWRRAENKK